MTESNGAESNVYSLEHGKKKEPIARNLYIKELQSSHGSKFTVLPAGLSINPKYSFLGISPDGKVIYPFAYFPYGLLEIKCPSAGNNKTLDEKCQEDSFYLKKVGDRFYLDRSKLQSRKYYAQVQGQLALTGLPWCDFVVYLNGSQNMAVERIMFDEPFWADEMLPKLTKFYFGEIIPFLNENRDILHLNRPNVFLYDIYHNFVIVFSHISCLIYKYFRAISLRK